MLLHRVGRFWYSAGEVRCEWALREQTVLTLMLTLSFNSARMMGTVCVKAPLHSSAPQASQPRPAPPCPGRTWRMYTLTAPHSPATSVGKHVKDTSAALLMPCHLVGFIMNNPPEVKCNLNSKCLTAGAYKFVPCKNHSPPG